MSTVVWTAILPYSGRAIRFENPDTSVALKIAEAAEEAVGIGTTGVKYINALHRQTILHALRGITSKPIPLVYKDEPLNGEDGKPLLKDGKPVTRKVVDEEASIDAIKRDEDAVAKGCPWIPCGHLDMITVGSPTELSKLFPQGDDYLELFKAINSAGARPRLPLSGRARMTVTAT